MHRKNNKPWLVTMTFDEWMSLYKMALKGADIGEDERQQKILLFKVKR